MRRNSDLVLICCITFCILLSGTTYAGDQKFKVESWEERLNKRQPPVAIMDAIGVEPGMVIGEIGAGTGRMTMWLAERLGPAGRLYANDIKEESLDKLSRRAEKAGFQHVEIIVGEVDDPMLPPESLDMLFMINVYHHVANPVILLRNGLPSLKTDGMLVIVECDPGKADWAAEHGCTGKKKMEAELAEAGYEVVTMVDILSEDQIYVARPREQ